MATGLEQRMWRPEHGLSDPLTVIVRSFDGRIGDPMTIVLSSTLQHRMRATGESVDPLRPRALSGPDDAGTVGVVVLSGHNATGSDTTTQARRERGGK
jgi:hypothetical protein